MVYGCLCRLARYFMTKLMMEAGRNDLVFTWANKTDFPSYGHFLKLGYTTWPEQHQERPVPDARLLQRHWAVVCRGRGWDPSPRIGKPAAGEGGKSAMLGSVAVPFLLCAIRAAGMMAWFTPLARVLARSSAPTRAHPFTVGHATHTASSRCRLFGPGSTPATLPGHRASGLRCTARPRAHGSC